MSFVKIKYSSAQQFFLKNCSSYYQGKMDLWYFFTCYGIDILKPKGLLGFITPNNWVTNAGASILRNKVLTDSTILNIVDFGAFMVFENASIQTMVFVLENKKSKQPKWEPEVREDTITQKKSGKKTKRPTYEVIRTPEEAAEVKKLMNNPDLRAQKVLYY